MKCINLFSDNKKVIIKTILLLPKITLSYNFVNTNKNLGW